MYGCMYLRTNYGRRAGRWRDRYKAKIEIEIGAAAICAGRKEPYWQKIERGLSVGYHRPLKGGAGSWWARVLVEGKYKIEALGLPTTTLKPTASASSTGRRLRRPPEHGRQSRRMPGH